MLSYYTHPKILPLSEQSFHFNCPAFFCWVWIPPPLHDIFWGIDKKTTAKPHLMFFRRHPLFLSASITVTKIFLRSSGSVENLFLPSELLMLYNLFSVTKIIRGTLLDILWLLWFELLQSIHFNIFVYLLRGSSLDNNNFKCDYWQFNNWKYDRWVVAYGFMHIFYSNSSIFVDIEYCWYFMLSLFKLLR